MREQTAPMSGKAPGEGSLMRRDPCTQNLLRPELCSRTQSDLTGPNRVMNDPL
jgi:hypothetical protein